MKQEAEKPETIGVDRRLLCGALFTALITLCVFLAALNNNFVDMDDLGYIILNKHLGLFSWETVIWAFTRFHMYNWHPLTMLSLALDGYLWGLNPFGFHLTNIVIHSGSVFFACFLFASLLGYVYNTRQAGCMSTAIPTPRQILVGSLLAALIFGLHPLRVESVVWASERKDVLYIFFTIATLWWQIRYIEERSSAHQAHFFYFRSYWVVLFMASLALMSKPAAVCLPVVMLIMEWYPLERIKDRTSLQHAVVEKIPLLLAAAGVCLLTVMAQDGAIGTAQVSPLSRVLIACKALVFYLWKMLWPAGLAPFYPHPGNVTASALSEFLVYGALVVVVSSLVVVFARKQRMWAALWSFYLITLIPVLGLIQVGGQWAADRYTYLPSLGISLLWGGAVVWLTRRFRPQMQKTAELFLVAFLCCQLVVYSVVTLRLIPVWLNTGTLTTRVIELMPHQVGSLYLSRALYRDGVGDFEGALMDLNEALADAQNKGFRQVYSVIAFSKAHILINLGRMAEALDAAELAVQASIGEPDKEHLALRDELAQRYAR